MKHIIIGTAGHVDHGKTTLIKALTGTDTDRLKEEQERGMTIDLGFASLTLADGTIAGIVDVPGHEKFIRNMLAGAVGMDIVMLVIAADEGIMPQTVEHLDILRLLDVKSGVIVLTKYDMVDAEWRSVVEEDIRTQLAETFLARSPLIRVNSLSGKGIPELKKTLLSSASRAEPRNAALPFRLPVDRVFTRPGFGTVVTGTLAAGTLQIGDSIEILPQGIQTRARGLQTHGKKQIVAEAGTRLAVNLAGVEVAQVARGTLLAPPGTLAATRCCDALLRLLPNAPRPLLHRARVRLYLGTAEIMGRVSLLGTDNIAPGGEAYVQFRAEEPFVGARGEPFVIRSFSPMQTIGGGILLDTAPLRHRRFDEAVLHGLEAKRRGTPEDLLTAWLESRPFGGTQAEAGQATGLPESEIQNAVERLCEKNRLVRLIGEKSPRLILIGKLTATTDRALHILDAYHTANPLRAGMPKEEMRGAFHPVPEPRAFGTLLAYWQETGKIGGTSATLRLADYTVRLSPRQQDLYDRVLQTFQTAGSSAPSAEEVADRLHAPLEAIEAMIRVALDQGSLVRITDGFYYTPDILEAAKQTVRTFIHAQGSITVSQYRDQTNTSRKYALPVMEYLDSIHFTRRVGDVRVLAEVAEEA